MMKDNLSYLSILAILLLATSSTRALQVSETFDTDPNWDAFNNTSGLNNFGWSNSNNVGLGAGEIGGFLARDGGTPDFAYYGANVGQLDPSTDSLSFSGTAVFKDPQLDYFLIGFFTGSAAQIPGDAYPANFMGIYSDDRFLFLQTTADNAFSQSPVIIQPDVDVPWEFSLTYDPDENSGTGALIGTVAGVPITFALPEGHKDGYLDFTHFGIVTRNANNFGAITGRSTPTYVDSVEYTVEDVVTEDADFDDDNDVDGSDFLIWQRGFQIGLTNAEGDANGDNMVDEIDLGIWQAQYGGPPPVTPVVAAVPEPSSWLLGMVALGLLGIKRSSKLRS